MTAISFFYSFILLIDFCWCGSGDGTQPLMCAWRASALLLIPSPTHPARDYNFKTDVKMTRSLFSPLCISTCRHRATWRVVCVGSTYISRCVFIGSTCYRVTLECSPIKTMAQMFPQILWFWWTLVHRNNICRPLEFSACYGSCTPVRQEHGRFKASLCKLGRPPCQNKKSCDVAKC